MLLRRSIGASSAPARSRPHPVHPLRVQGLLWRLTLVASLSSANMGGNDGGGGEEEKGKGKGKVNVDDQAAAAAAAAAPPSAKEEEKEKEDRSALLDSLASFKGFVVEEVLNVNDMNKVAAVVGSFPGAPGRAVVRLARQPFDRARLAAPGSVGEEEEEEEEKEEGEGKEGERASKRGKAAAAAAAGGGGGGSGGSGGGGGLLGASLRLSKTLRNDIYGTYSGSFLPLSESLLEAAGAGLAVDVTYPATEKHIAKMRAQQRVMLLETRELYEKITLPLVEATPASRVAWVDNILEGRAEADRVMARGGGGEGEDEEKNGWVLLPDMKWDHRRAAAALAELRELEEKKKKKKKEEEGDGDDAFPSDEALAAASDRAKSARESFYAQLIFRDKGLKSLRDIDGETTAPRVAAAVDAALAFVKSEYGIPRSSLRAFFHYHPSYWRLHVHIVGPQAFPDDGAGRAHLVDDVLEAARARPGWWRERALCVRSFRGDELAEALIAAGGEQQ